MDSASCLLYVGIDPATRSAIDETLAQSGILADTVAEPDVESALSFLKNSERSIDCIVSAYHLSGMDGVDFSRERTHREADPSVPLVLFVEDGSESIAASALNAGISGYVRQDPPDAIDRITDQIRRQIEPDRQQDGTDTGSPFESCREELHWERERLEEVRRALSHDLRSPLNVAKGYLQYVSNQADGPDNEEDDEAISKITVALNRIDSFLGDLNALVQQGRPVVSPESLTLSEVARSAWSETNAEDASLRVVGDEPPPSDDIVADHERLVGLFRELYRNAVVHGSREVTIEVGPLTDGFYVSDDGRGIPDNRRGDVLREAAESRLAVSRPPVNRPSPSIDSPAKYHVGPFGGFPSKDQNDSFNTFASRLHNVPASTGSG